MTRRHRLLVPAVTAVAATALLMPTATATVVAAAPSLDDVEIVNRANGGRWGPYADATGQGNDIYTQRTTDVVDRKTLTWALNDVADTPYWTIENVVGAGKCVQPETVEVGGNLELQPCNGSRGQQWVMTHDLGTTYVGNVHKKAIFADNAGVIIRPRNNTDLAVTITAFNDNAVLELQKLRGSADQVFAVNRPGKFDLPS